MTTSASGEPDKQPRDAEHWSKVSALRVGQVPAGARNLNADGRQVVGPLQGFGQMWQKSYRVRLADAGVTPAEVIAVWKEKFPEFQPPANHFYPSVAGVKPGEVVLIDTMLPIVPGLPGMIPMASGVMVLYADDESFTVMTPEGFPESGWNTFSAYDEDGTTVAQVQSIARANDPIYEIGFRFMGGARQQEETWMYVLTSLARHFGVESPVEMIIVLLDPRLQWSEAGNVWHNAGIRSMLYTAAAPLRWARDRLKGGVTP